jgi:hypothetical protein
MSSTLPETRSDVPSESRENEPSGSSRGNIIPYFFGFAVTSSGAGPPNAVFGVSNGSGGCGGDEDIRNPLGMPRREEISHSDFNGDNALIFLRRWI